MSKVREGEKTYDVSPAIAEGEIRRDSMHIVEHVNSAHLLCLSVHLILDVAVIEALLDAHDCLCILAIGIVHHEYSIEEAVVGQRVLTLHHDLATADLARGHEGCPILILHWTRTSTNQLK